MFQPPLSSFRVRVCCPAGRVTVASTAVHVCPPPVAGMLTFPLRLVPELLEMRRASVTAEGAATRRPTVYLPAVATFTVYRNHCPLPVQPRSSPPPVSEVAS